MADLQSEADKDRSKLNADKSTSFHDNQELIDFYKEWSAKYDEDFRPELYVGPRLTAGTLADIFPSDEERKKVDILDIAAGTGLVGLELSRLGFTTIDAVDACEDMLKRLMEKEIYRNASKVIFGTNDPVPIATESYDAVTSCGGFVPGHLPVSTLDEMLRVCKRGGVVVIVMRHEFLQREEYRTMEATIDDWEKRGLWERIKKSITPNYYLEKEGIVFAYRKL